jgi:hypothetical protein
MISHTFVSPFSGSNPQWLITTYMNAYERILYSHDVHLYVIKYVFFSVEKLYMK